MTALAFLQIVFPSCAIAHQSHITEYGLGWTIVHLALKLLKVMAHCDGLGRAKVTRSDFLWTLVEFGLKFGLAVRLWFIKYTYIWTGS